MWNISDLPLQRVVTLCRFLNLQVHWWFSTGKREIDENFHLLCVILSSFFSFARDLNVRIQYFSLSSPTFASSLPPHFLLTQPPSWSPCLNTKEGLISLFHRLCQTPALESPNLDWIILLHTYPQPHSPSAIQSPPLPQQEAAQKRWCTCSWTWWPSYTLESQVFLVFH